MSVGEKIYNSEKLIGKAIRRLVWAEKKTSHKILRPEISWGPKKNLGNCLISWILPLFDADGKNSQKVLPNG